MKIKTLLTSSALAMCTLLSAQPSTQNKIVLTTTKAVGETIGLGINAAKAEQADIWIDLNNNGIRESGEEVTNFDSTETAKYTLGSRTITIYGNVDYLDCKGCRLIELDVTNNPKLTELNSSGNHLRSLDVSKNPDLFTLATSGNLFTSLDVSKNPKLTGLYCYFNRLTSLDISNNTKLVYFDCYDNQITSLDVSKNTELIKLYCESNQLEALNVKNNTKLKDFRCSDNQMDACALNALFNSLYEVPQKPNENFIYDPSDPDDPNLPKPKPEPAPEIQLKGNPGVSTSNTKIAKDKGWKVDAEGDGSAVCPEDNGIHEETATLLQVYPNPARGVLRVSLPGDMQGDTLAILDMAGKTVYSQLVSDTHATIDIRAFAPGLYVVKIGNVARKVVVQ